jgi:iron-sulfur cluster assembly protein
MITLTASAARHMTKLLAQRGRGIGIQLDAKGAGCSGFSYQVDYVDEVDPKHQVFESHGVHIYIDPHVLPLLDGIEIGFVSTGLNENLTFNNPNATGECGCGKSFTVDK